MDNDNCAIKRFLPWREELVKGKKEVQFTIEDQCRAEQWIFIGVQS